MKKTKKLTNQTLSSYTQPAKGIILGLLIVFGISYAMAAWTGPTQAPPGGNTSAPLNVGSTGQSKSGGLILNTGGATNGLIVQNGNVGIGTTNPGSLLDLSSDSSKVSLTRPSNGRTGYVSILNTQGGLRYHGGVNGVGEGSSVSHQFTGDSSALNTIYMTILGNGNIGVGTTNPSEKLDVVGNIKASGTVCGSGGCVGDTIGGSGGVQDVVMVSGCSDNGEGYYPIQCPAGSVSAGVAGFRAVSCGSFEIRLCVTY